MIVTNTELAKTKTYLTEEKKFIEWMKDSDIAYGPLLALDAFDLITIISQGFIKADTKEFKEIFCNPAFSSERAEGIRKFRDRLGLKSTDSIINRKPRTRTEQIIDSLKILDELNISSILADEEAINSIIIGKVDKLWNELYNSDNHNKFIKFLKIQIKSADIKHKFFVEIIKIFLDEYNQVYNYEPPTGYNFPYELTLMQKLYVKRVIEKHYYANWSGMGSGKTLATIVVSRQINSRLTVLVVNNDTVGQWCSEILKAYPDSVVYNAYEYRDYDKIDFDYSKHNYLVIPCSRFSINTDSIKIVNLAKKRIDLLACDEVQNFKATNDNCCSIRRENLKRLIKISEETNPDIYRIIMTGTPYVNTIEEPKSLLSLLLNDKLSDIQTNKQNSLTCSKVNHLLNLHGLRIVPEYDAAINIIDNSKDSDLWVNADSAINNIAKLNSNEYTKVYAYTLKMKLNAVRKYIKPGTTIYTQFTTYNINNIVNYVTTELGYKCTLYTGFEKQNLKEFTGYDDKITKKHIEPTTDVLIASSPISTGVNGLQERCSRIIILSFPQTGMLWDQLLHRFYRPDVNNKVNDIEVIIPFSYINMPDGTWSWDVSAYNLIKVKKTYADYILDGITDNKTDIAKLKKQARTSLVNFKNRVNETLLVRKKESLDASEINPDDTKPRNYSVVTSLNEKGHHWSSDIMHKFINDNPQILKDYHKVRTPDMQNWDEIPYEVIAKHIKNKKSIVADFGCGENLFKECIPNTVYGFDHYALNESVIACNMNNIPLEDESIDVAIFSLSLWGTKNDINDYFKEAYRVLNYGGQIYVAETNKRYTTLNDKKQLVEQLNKIGFEIIGEIDIHETFFYINMIKK